MTVVDLDDSGHLVASVVPATAALAEEQDAGDQCEKSAGNSDEESPVEHHTVFLESNVEVLVHESSINSDTNTNADSCNTSIEQCH